jgi:acid phosphatase (class A)
VVLLSLRRAWIFGLFGIGAVWARAGAPYLSQFDSVALLPPPPAQGSAEDRADRDSAFEVYASRTPDDIARAKAEHLFTVFVFAPILGPEFTAQNCPKTAALFDEVLKEAKSFTDPAKAHWKRPRPYVLDPKRFDRPADRENSESYPSGHSTRGTALAEIMAVEFPDKAEALLAKGRLIGWTRVEAGVHTPMDIMAGRVLGRSLAQAFLHNPSFQADLAQAKAEVQALRP